MYQLRNYQLETINNIYQSLQNNHHAIIVQQPPRTGKTVIMAEIARRTTAKGNHILFIAHRKELIDQARNTFIKNDVDMNLCQIGMVQTLTRHLDHLVTPQVILVDEGHHILAKSYQRIIKQFPKAIKLYFTATPYRTGRKQLDLIADDLIIGKSIQWLTDNHFLAPFKYYSVDYINHRFLKRNSTGDYTENSIDKAMNNKIYGNVVKHYQTFANHKKAIIYCYSIKNALAVANRFNQNGINAREIDSNTAKEQREKIIEQFKNGDVTVLTNVNLFTEGLDLPNVDCVIMLRPTMSLSLYLQFAMRCLNPRKDKQAVIIDHVGNWQRFGLPDEERNWRDLMTTSEGKHKGGPGREPEIIQCSKCFAVFKRTSLIKGCCPFCNNKIESDDDSDGYQETDDKLVEIKEKLATQKRLQLVHQMIANQVALNVADKSIYELSTYQEFEAYAQLNGYSKKWAYCMFNQMRRRKQ